MNNDILLRLDILLLWWSTGCAQTYNDKIVSPSVVESSQTFTVTCDASRAGVPVDFTTVLLLYIKRVVGGKTEDLTRYRSIIDPKVINDTSPTSFVNWSFNFSGSLRGTANRPVNRNTMKIEIVAPQAKCTDAGRYVCFATYFNKRDDEVDTESYQDLTVTVPEGTWFEIKPASDYLLEPYVALYPAGSKVELTCSLEK
ncbi:uncharacterized protein LOC131934598, partial [Physella acuta]|uniref:uncharacterized protein LOC131934598 n=1 Tax=Physella acuta TaxID=109671 RepID=UPI0027DE98E3